MCYTSDNQTGKQHIDSLTGARFLAIMIIVCSHFEFLKDYGELGDIYWRYFHNSTMGVDYFFLLSGFGMMLSNIRHNRTTLPQIDGIQTLINYAIKHIRKIYPVYVAFLLFGIPFFILSGYIEHGLPMWKLIAKSAFYLTFDMTLLQSATGIASFSHSLNGVCWFLSTLFCIYLISPLIIYIIRKHVKTLKFCTFCIVLTIFTSFYLSVLFTWLDNYTFFNELCYASPYSRVFYVILGMFIAQIYSSYEIDNNLRFPAFISKGYFEYILFFFSFLWFFLRCSLEDILGYSVYIIDMILVSGDIFVLALSYGTISKILSSKKSIFLGEISMYIFLSHYNIRNYIDLIVRLSGINTLIIAIIEVIIVITLTMVVSCIIHNFRTNSNQNLDGLICKYKYRINQFRTSK